MELQLAKAARRNQDNTVSGKLKVQFFSFIITIWGVASGASVALPFANALIGVLPVHPDFENIAVPIERNRKRRDDRR